MEIYNLIVIQKKSVCLHLKVRLVFPFNDSKSLVDVFHFSLDSADKMKF